PPPLQLHPHQHLLLHGTHVPPLTHPLLHVIRNSVSASKGSATKPPSITLHHVLSSLQPQRCHHLHASTLTPWT
ncbi:hypothetical protein VIGAN_08290300, partial [Vigna angularis var. angularis]